MKIIGMAMEKMTLHLSAIPIRYRCKGCPKKRYFAISVNWVEFLFLNVPLLQAMGGLEWEEK